MAALVHLSKCLPGAGEQGADAGFVQLQRRRDLPVAVALRPQQKHLPIPLLEGAQSRTDLSRRVRIVDVLRGWLRYPGRLAPANQQPESSGLGGSRVAKQV